MRSALGTDPSGCSAGDELGDWVSFQGCCSEPGDRSWRSEWREQQWREVDTRGAVKATESTDLEDWASERIHPNEACERRTSLGVEMGEKSPGWYKPSQSCLRDSGALTLHEQADGCTGLALQKEGTGHYWLERVNIAQAKKFINNFSIKCYRKTRTTLYANPR